MKIPRLLDGWALAVVFILAVGAAAQTSLAPTELLNRSYVSSCGRSKPESVPVKDGKFGRYLLLADEERKIELIVLGAEEIKVPGDRRQQFAVFAKCDVLGKGGYELFVLRRSGKRLMQIASAVSAGFGDLYQLKYIKVADGLIVVGLAYLLSRNKLPTDGSSYEFRYRLSGSKIESAGHGYSDQ